MDDRSSLGIAGEDAADGVYRSRGFRIVARNWRCRIGELDLIVARDDLLVICEVKTRRGDAYGGGYEAVTGRKRAKVRAVAEAFILASGLRPRSVRFDVASVDARSRGRVVVELFEDAF